MSGLASSLGLGHHFLEREWGEEEARGSLEGLGAPDRRAREGLGLGPRPVRGSNRGYLPEAPSWGPLGPIFQSVRNTARRIFRVGAGPRPRGQTGRSRRGPPNASLLG